MNTAVEVNIINNLSKYPEILTDFFYYLKEKEIRTSSIKTYMNVLTLFLDKYIDYQKNNKFYLNIPTNCIDEFLNGDDLLDEPSNSVLQVRWTVLCAFYKYLVIKKKVDNNPIIAIKRKENNKKYQTEILQKKDIYKLINAIDSNEDIFLAKRDKAIITLILTTGISSSEIGKLSLEDYNEKDLTITIGNRIIPISNQQNTLLLDWIKISKEKFEDINNRPIFLSQKLTPITTAGIGHMIRKYCLEANIKMVSSNDLRASSICEMLRCNVPIEKISKLLNINKEQCVAYAILAFNNNKINPVDILSNFVFGDSQISNKSIQKISIRTLLAFPERFYNTHVEIKEELSVTANHIRRKSLSTYLSTGPRPYDYNTNVSIEVFYTKDDDYIEEMIQIDSARQKIKVRGFVKKYSDSNTPYIIASQILGYS